LVIERRQRHRDVVIVCSRQSIHWYPRGSGGLSAGARISEEETDPVASGSPRGGVSDRGLQQRRHPSR
jgi:hypothetical protein